MIIPTNARCFVTWSSFDTSLCMGQSSSSEDAYPRLRDIGLDTGAAAGAGFGDEVFAMNAAAGTAFGFGDASAHFSSFMSVSFSTSALSSFAELLLLSFTPFSSSTPFFLFFPWLTQCTASSLVLSGTTSSSWAFLSASSCLRRKTSNCSSVSFFTSASFRRVAASTESRNSASSSSRGRYWFFRRVASSKASCLAA